jgi:NAD(P)-dependent dehydrogenase (short-subunit alcohol dehydrogenase family)
VDQIETAEGRAIAVRADVRDVDAIERMTDQTATAFGSAFSRLWLGVRSATSRSRTDELSASPDLLAELDRVSCLPSQRPMGTTSPR